MKTLPFKITLQAIPLEWKLKKVLISGQCKVISMPCMLGCKECNAFIQEAQIVNTAIAQWKKCVLWNIVLLDLRSESLLLCLDWKHGNFHGFQVERPGGGNIHGVSVQINISPHCARQTIGKHIKRHVWKKIMNKQINEDNLEPECDDLYPQTSHAN